MRTPTRPTTINPTKPRGTANPNPIKPEPIRILQPPNPTPRTKTPVAPRAKAPVSPRAKTPTAPSRGRMKLY